MSSVNSEKNEQAEQTVDEVIAEAQNCFQRGDLIHAGKLLEDAQPKDSSVHIKLLLASVKVSLARGHLREALALFAPVRDADLLADESLVVALIDVYSRLQDIDSWTILGDKAREKNKKSVSIAVALSRAHIAARQPRKAVEYLTEAEQWPDASPEVFGLLLFARAAVDGCGELSVWAAKAREDHPGAEAEIFYYQGLACLEYEWSDEAVEFLQRTIDGRHEYTCALIDANRADEAQRQVDEGTDQAVGLPGQGMARACTLVRTGDYKMAAEYVLGVLDQVPDDCFAVLAAIEILRRVCKFPDAENVANRALASEHLTEPWKVRAALGCVLVDQGKRVDGVQEVERALTDARADTPMPGKHLDDAGCAQRKGMSDPDFLLACISALRHAYRYDLAKQIAQGALRAKEKIAERWKIRTALAWVFSDEGAYQAALDCVDQALAELEEQKIPHHNEGFRWAVRSRIDFLREAYRFDEASAEVEKALNQARANETNPDLADLLMAKAWILSDQDEEDAAACVADQVLPGCETYAVALTARIYFLRWARNFRDAEEAAKRAEGQYRDDPDVLTAIGWLHSDKGEREDAVHYANRALGIDETNAWALSSRIVFNSVAGCYKEAKHAVDAAQCARSGEPRVHVAAGWLWGDQDRYDLALQQFGQALGVNPHEAEALEWRVVAQRADHDLDQALADAREGKRSRPDDPAMRLELGKAHDDRREFQLAETDFGQILALEHDNVAAGIARSVMLRAQHRPDVAELEIETMLRRKSGNRYLRAELGWIYLDQRRFSEAWEQFDDLRREAAPNNNSEKASALYGQGWARLEEGRADEAASHFREALGYRLKDANYQLGLAWALAGQADKRDEARKLAAEVATRRRDPFAETCLGVLEYHDNRFDEAERRFRRALALDPYGSRTDLGALYVRLARYEDAQTELLRALQRDPGDRDAQFQLGCLYLQPGYENFPAAERAFRKVLAYLPASAEAVVGLAQTLAATDRDMEAESLLRRALRQDSSPGRWRIELALARLLVQQGSAQDSEDLLREALKQARAARADSMKTGATVTKDNEADLAFTVGAAEFHLASVTPGVYERYVGQRDARRDLEQCKKLDEDHVEALRYLALLKRVGHLSSQGVIAVRLTAVVSLGLLALEWVLFLLGYERVSSGLVAADTPILAGLFMVSFLLPTLIHLKLPGFEAEMEPSPQAIARPPDGRDMMRGARLVSTTGPSGQIPRHGADTPHTKPSKHLLRLS